MKIFITLILFFSLPLVFGHGAIHEQIEEVTNKLKKSQDDIDLYAKRGRLYIEDRSLAKAIKDYETILSLDKNNRNAHYYLGRIALLQKKYLLAVRKSNKFISMLSNETGAQVRGFILQGHAYDGLNDFEKSAQAYEKVTNLTKEPRPSYFLDLSTAYEKQKKFTKALRALDKGESALGDLVVFHDRAIAIEKKSGNYDAAVKRLSKRIEKGRGLASLYEQKAHFLMLSKREKEARLAYKNALYMLNKTPASRQNNRAFKVLSDKIHAGLKGE